MIKEYSNSDTTDGEATISGVMVEADETTGLANKVEPIVLGKYLENRI